MRCIVETRKGTIELLVEEGRRFSVETTESILLSGHSILQSSLKDKRWMDEIPKVVEFYLWEENKQTEGRSMGKEERERLRIKRPSKLGIG